MVNKWCLQSFRGAASARTRMTGLGADPGPDGAGHARAAQAAIPGGVLCQVLLVIVLGEIKLTGWSDLGGDRTQSLGRQRLLVGGLRGIRGFTLGIVERVD